MAASDKAVQLFDALPADGEKISGGKLKNKLGFNTTELKNAKDELKKAGLVVLGGGRGGSIARVEGAEVERPVKVSNDEALEMAREAKKEKTRAQKESDALHEHVEAVGHRKFPDADDIQVGLYDSQWYVMVWNGKSAFPHFLEDEELL